MKICRFFALLCAIAILSLTVACTGDDPIEDDSKTESKAEATTDSGKAEEVTTAESEDNGIVLAKDGQLYYRIVYPTEGGQLFHDSAYDISDTIKAKIGLEPKVAKESTVTEGEWPTIYVGMTDASRKTGDTVASYHDWKITTDGTDIYIIASGTTALSRAVTVFNGRIKAGATDNGITLTNFVKSGEVTTAGAEAPFNKTDKTSWCYSIYSGGGYETVIANADESDFTAYKKQLTDENYALCSENKTVAGKFATFKNDTQAVYVSLIGTELRAIALSINYAFLPDTAQPTYTKVCDTTAYLLGVTGNGTEENGLGMIYRLADGSFIIYDMGLNENDADNIYNNLSSLASEVGLSDITVSGWFFTHGDGDHVGGVKIFFQKYGDKVNVKNVFFNQTTSDEGTASTTSYSATEKSIVASINKYSPDTKVCPLHTGQYFWLADVKVEVLYTVEDLKQGIFDNYNDCSTVTRLTINGKKVLMVGDAATRVWTLIVPRYGSELKSDYLQVPHHGVQPGGTTAAYQAIQPEYLFWPAGQALYEKALKNEPSKYLRGTVADDHVYIAGSLGNVTKITFSKDFQHI